MNNITMNKEVYGISNSLLERIRNAIDMNLKTQIRKIVPNLHPADQADLIEILNHDERKKLVEILKDQLDAEAILELSEDVRNEIIKSYSNEDLANIFGKLDVDDIVEILQGIEDEETVQDVINKIKSKSTRELIEESLSYPEGSVGRLMAPLEFAAVPKDWTVEEFIKYSQKNKALTGKFSEIVVVDDYYRPVSTISAGQILIASQDKKISEVMRDPDDLKILRADMTQEDAANLFIKYDLRSAPVVNDNGVLVGMIYLFDIIDVVEKESTEDLMLMGNVSEDDMHSTIFSTIKKRLPWLFMTILTTSIGTFIIDAFGDTVEKMVILAALLPLLAGVGGVCSSQTLTVMIRNLAGHNITKSNYKKVIFKEFCTGLLNGIVLGIFSLIAIFLWQKNLQLAIIFGCTVAIVLSLSSTIASIVPITIDKLGLDPAAASSSFTTTTIDTLSFLTLLKLASIFLM